jgi:hypothetical protein
VNKVRVRFVNFGKMIVRKMLNWKREEWTPSVCSGIFVTKHGHILMPSTKCH